MVFLTAMIHLLIALHAFAAGHHSELTSAVARAVAYVPKPRPEFSFVIETKEQVRIAVKWDQQPSLDLKNDVRDRILWEAKKTLGNEKRFVSVVFTDELVAPSWK